MIEIPKISILTIFGLSLLVFTDPARSEMIHVANSSSGEFSSFIDTNSITSSGRFVEGSVTRENSVPINGISSSTSRMRANCSYRSMKSMAYAAYDSRGKLLLSDQKPLGWYAVLPGSVAEAEYNFLCRI